MNPAHLVLPAVRWNAENGFAGADQLVGKALDSGAGGFLIFGGTADAVADVTQRMQRIAGRPLLLAADLERGAGQQIQGLREIPPPGALGWLDDLGATETAGRVTAQDARSVGLNWVLAPVADLDCEPRNPIVQTRAFGADPEHVARHVEAWVRGCQSAALACVKHFPGHGRTVSDSHQGLPVVNASGADLSEDRFPFRQAIRLGVDTVMTAHVSYPSLDASGVPATFSHPILHQLREQGFGGLITTDALMMDGARSGRTPGDAAIAALRAGVDILLYPPDPIEVMQRLRKAATREEGLAAQIRASLGRRESALESIHRRTGDTEERGTLAGLPVRLLEGGMARGVRPRLAPPINVVIVDDDQDGSYPPTPHSYVRDALEMVQIPCGMGGSTLLCTFAEPRAGKPWGGFGERSRRLIAEWAPRANLIVHFGHPRLVAVIPGKSPIVVAWHRQRLMQEAVATFLAEHMA